MKFSKKHKVFASKNLKSDQRGFSLVELIISAALLTIIASAFASATLGSSKNVEENRERQKLRAEAIGNIDKRISKTKLVTGEEINSDVAGIELVNINSSGGQIKLTTDGDAVGERTEDCYIVKSITQNDENKNNIYRAYVAKTD